MAIHRQLPALLTNGSPRNGDNTAECQAAADTHLHSKERSGTTMDAERQSSVIDDDGFSPTLMPTLLRARQVRLLAWFLCFWATAIGIYIARIVGFDLYVRAHWTVVEGDIIKYE